MAINIIQPENGTLSVTESEGVATITATADDGYELDWVSATSEGELLDVVDMSFDVPESDVEVTGAFAESQGSEPEQVGQHFLDAAFENGEVWFEVGGEVVVAASAGQTVAVVANPFVGYELASIIGVELDDGVFTMPDADVSIEVVFSQIDYAVTCTSEVIADVETAHAGDEVTVAAVDVPEGEEFLGIVVEWPNGVFAWSLDSYIVFEMPPSDVDVREMTEAERESYATPTDVDQESEGGDTVPSDSADAISDDEERDSGTVPDDTPPDPSFTPTPAEEAADGIPGEEYVNPEPEIPDVTPEPTYHTETRHNDEIVSDYSADTLAAYKALGAKAVAVYSDGTEAYVDWDDVRDPAKEPVEVVNEAYAVAEATNQHFWTRKDNTDGAGAGAFVTDEEQDTWLEAVNAGTEPTESRPLHNLLMNAEGILLRAAKKIRAAFTPSGVAFYDGEGNEASNIVAQFGKDGARIGEVSNKHLDIGVDGMRLSDANAQYFDIAASYDRVHGEGTASLTLGERGEGAVGKNSISLGGGVASGRGSFAAGSAVASGVNSFASGSSVTGSEVRKVTASGQCSTAFGSGTTASGKNSFSAGYESSASNDSSVAMGYWTEASGGGSFAVGMESKAAGYCSAALGKGTVAQRSYMMAVGQYNVENDTSDLKKLLFVVGNGTGDTKRSDAFRVFSNGVWTTGDVTFGGSTSLSGFYEDLATKSRAKNLVYASPSTAAGAPTFRTLVSDDLPSIPLDSTKLTGILPVSRGGTGAAGGALAKGKFLASPADQAGSAAYRNIAASDIPDLSATYAKASHTHSYLPLSGGTMAGSILASKSNGPGYYQMDSSGFSYPALRDNGSNLWIGATQTAAQHHKGGVYISSGHNGTSGNETINISVPNAANNNATNYKVYHTGYKPSAADVGAVPRTPTSGWSNLNVFQVTGNLPDDTTTAVPAAVRPCLIASRNGSMALYW